MALTTTQINQLYVSYFGRPADVNGLQFYQNSNATPNQVAIAFSNSAESQALFGGLSVNAQINAIYQNLFNRDAETAGLSYWSQQVNAGNISVAGVALAIGNGAQGADRTAIENKVVIANSFVAALDTAAEIVGYSGDAAASSARSFIKTIGASTNIATAQGQVNGAVAAAVNVGGTVGTTYALTTGLDVLTGTANNDTFVANPSVIQAGDTINGGAGNDTFVYAGATAATPDLPTLQNIESVQFSAPTVALTVNATGLTGVTAVSATGSVGGHNITIGSGQSATFTNAGTVASDTITSTAASVNAGVNGGITLTTLTVADAALTTLNLASNGAANTITTLTTNGTAAAQSLNLYGTSKLTIGSLAPAFTTVNASATTGGVDLTFATGDVAVTGGSGADRFNFGATLTSADKVDGGAGNDVIAVTGADFTASAQSGQLTALNAVTNIETLEFTGTAATTIAGGSAATSFTNSTVTKILFNTSDTTNVDTVNSAGSARTYAFGALNDGAATLNLAAGVTTVNVSLEGAATSAGGAAAVTTLTVAPLPADLTATPSLVNTVNIASSGVSGVAANTITAVTAQAGSTLKVTGSNDLTIAGVTNRAIVDASTFTGKLAITGSTGADTITLGTAADTVTVQAAGSTYSAIDTINGFARADTLVLTGTTVNATASTFVKADVTAALSFEQALATAEAAIGGTTASTNAAWFNYGGNTYVLANVDGANSASTAGSGDLIVKITGTQTLIADATGIHGA